MWFSYLILPECWKPQLFKNEARLVASQIFSDIQTLSGFIYVENRLWTNTPLGSKETDMKTRVSFGIHMFTKLLPLARNLKGKVLDSDRAGIISPGAFRGVSEQGRCFLAACSLLMQVSHEGNTRLLFILAKIFHEVLTHKCITKQCIMNCKES